MMGHSRFAIVRLWAGAAAATTAAAVADAATEFAGNRGWLGTALHDNQHEAILPALIAGALLAVSLLLFVLLSRISPRDPLLLQLGRLRTRSIDVAGGFFGSMLCVIAMEGYEKRFGGLSPFDPGSVVLSHALTLAIAFVAIGAIVHCALRAAIGSASRAGVVVAAFIAAFFRGHRNAGQPRRIARLSAFDLHVTHVPPGIARGSCGFRAPPRSHRSDHAIA